VLAVQEFFDKLYILLRLVRVVRGSFLYKGHVQTHLECQLRRLDAYAFVEEKIIFFHRCKMHVPWSKAASITPTVWMICIFHSANFLRIASPSLMSFASGASQDRSDVTSVS
jgi:hypothetical protein